MKFQLNSRYTYNIHTQHDDDDGHANYEFLLHDHHFDIITDNGLMKQNKTKQKFSFLIVVGKKIIN